MCVRSGSASILLIGLIGPLCPDSVHLCPGFLFALPLVTVRVRTWGELGLAAPALKNHGVFPAPYRFEALLSLLFTDLC